MHAAPSASRGLGDKVAIVTGAARGSGAAVCRSLAREGAAVVACDVLSTDETVAAVQVCGGSSVGVKCDVSRESDIARVVDVTLDRFGRIDILVNNAGFCGSERMQVAVEEFSIEEWDRVIEVNLKGQFLSCQGVWPAMRKQGSGKIVCIGSLAGKSSGTVVGPHYCAAKGGVHALVKWLAKKGAPEGIYVNGIAPGAIDTEMIRMTPIDPGLVPLGRLGLPEDIAEGVVFLASDASNYVTGTILDINGGVLMS